MNEAGLGPESATVLGQILAAKIPIEGTNNKRHWFAHVDLGKNNLGNAGLANLLKGVLRCDSIVSLDLGSNDIMIDGSHFCFSPTNNPDYFMVPKVKEFTDAFLGEKYATHTILHETLIKMMDNLFRQPTYAFYYAEGSKWAKLTCKYFGCPY